MLWILLIEQKNHSSSSTLSNSNSARATGWKGIRRYWNRWKAKCDQALVCSMVGEHAQFFSTPDGKETIFKWWRKAGIWGLVNGSAVLSPDNPFDDIYT